MPAFLEDLSSGVPVLVPYRFRIFFCFSLRCKRRIASLTPRTRSGSALCCSSTWSLCCSSLGRSTTESTWRRGGRGAAPRRAKAGQVRRRRRRTGPEGSARAPCARTKRSCAFRRSAGRIAALRFSACVRGRVTAFCRTRTSLTPCSMRGRAAGEVVSKLMEAPHAKQRGRAPPARVARAVFAGWVDLRMEGRWSCPPRWRWVVTRAAGCNENRAVMSS